jgi:hypothetical protein
MALSSTYCPTRRKRRRRNHVLVGVSGDESVKQQASASLRVT